MVWRRAVTPMPKISSVCSGNVGVPAGPTIRSSTARMMILWDGPSRCFFTEMKAVDTNAKDLCAFVWQVFWAKAWRPEAKRILLNGMIPNA